MEIERSHGPLPEDLLDGEMSSAHASHGHSSSGSGGSSGSSSSSSGGSGGSSSSSRTAGQSSSGGSSSTMRHGAQQGHGNSKSYYSKSIGGGAKTNLSDSDSDGGRAVVGGGGGSGGAQPKRESRSAGGSPSGRASGGSGRGVRQDHGSIGLSEDEEGESYDQLAGLSSQISSRGVGAKGEAGGDKESSGKARSGSGGSPRSGSRGSPKHSHSAGATGGDVNLEALQMEKRNLHAYLKVYERDFSKLHGRPVMRQEDIQPVTHEYQRYKELKILLKDSSRK